jgi:hypothetical protein
MKTSSTPYLDYSEECFHYSQIIEPERWRPNWETAMWQNLLWAAEGGEI